MNRTIQLAITLLFAIVGWTAAGTYAPAAGQPGSIAIAMDDTSIIAWSACWTNYAVGYDCDTEWQTPERAVGAAVGNSTNIVCLGEGGQITMVFAEPIEDGPGCDLAVFENAPNNNFLELAYCEVSSDGVNFVRFPNHSLTEQAVDQYGYVDPTDIDGLASKYRQGYGTPFDLAQVEDSNLDLDNVRYVRSVDIIGDGTYTDSDGNSIYDPFPSWGSAGFDLDAIGVLSNDTEEVSISAVSDSSEWGDQQGEFVITRKSWDLSSPLTVNIAISGSAENGVDFEALPAQVEIPAGSESVTLKINALSDSDVEGDEALTITLNSGTGYMFGKSAMAAITIHDSPLASWKSISFGEDAGSARAQDGADWDGDGKSNLLEYALGTDPKIQDKSDMLILFGVDAGVPYVEIVCSGGQTPVDVELNVMKSDCLSGGDSWVYAGTPEVGPEGELRLRMATESSSRGSYFFKLEALAR